MAQYLAVIQVCLRAVTISSFRWPGVRGRNCLSAALAVLCFLCLGLVFERNLDAGPVGNDLAFVELHVEF